MSDRSGFRLVASIIVVLSLHLVEVSIGHAAPVFVEAGSEFGRGMAELRGDECMIVAPAHVTAAMPEIAVYGARGARGNAVFVKNIGEKADDLAMYRVIANSGAICERSESAMLKAVPGTVIVTRDKIGSLRFQPVSITRRAQRLLELSFDNQTPQDAQGMSGSLLLEGGKPIGILLAVSPRANEPALARDFQYLAALEGPWVLGPASEVGKIGDSLALLRSIIDSRPRGDMGQVAAVQDLVRNGSALAGADLRGISLESVSADHGDFSKARLERTIFREASLRFAKLSEGYFDFADLKGVAMGGAVAHGTRFYYADLDGADLNHLKASRSNWTGASARDANFRNADLTSASFMFADLTGADFSGADLRQTLFIGAILDRAKFDGARFDRTDFTSATGDIGSFDDEQRKHMCASEDQRYFKVVLMRTVLSTRYRSGKDFDQLVERVFGLPVTINVLPRCANRDMTPAGWPAIDVDTRGGRSQRILETFRLDYASEPFDKFGLLSEFPKRIRDQLDRVQTAWKISSFLRIDHTRSREIESALEARRNETSFEGSFSLDDHTAVEMVRFKYAPESFGNNNWGAAAQHWISDERRRHGPDFKRDQQGRWSRFFPLDVIAAELNDRHTSLFRDWWQTVAQADQSPALVPFALSDRGRTFFNQAIRSLNAKGQKSLIVRPFIDLTDDKAANLSRKSVDQDNGFLAGATSRIRGIQPGSSAASYVVELKAEDVSNLLASRRLYLIGDIVGANLAEKKPSGIEDYALVVKMEPKSLAILSRTNDLLRFQFE